MQLAPRCQLSACPQVFQAPRVTLHFNYTQSAQLCFALDATVFIFTHLLQGATDTTEAY